METHLYLTSKCLVVTGESISLPTEMPLCHYHHLQCVEQFHKRINLRAQHCYPLNHLHMQNVTGTLQPMRRSIGHQHKATQPRRWTIHQRRHRKRAAASRQQCVRADGKSSFAVADFLPRSTSDMCCKTHNLEHGSLPAMLGSIAWFQLVTPTTCTEGQTALFFFAAHIACTQGGVFAANWQCPDVHCRAAVNAQLPWTSFEATIATIQLHDSQSPRILS